MDYMMSVIPFQMTEKSPNEVVDLASIVSVEENIANTINVNYKLNKKLALVKKAQGCERANYEKEVDESKS